MVILEDSYLIYRWNIHFALQVYIYCLLSLARFSKLAIQLVQCSTQFISLRIGFCDLDIYSDFDHWHNVMNCNSYILTGPFHQIIPNRSIHRFRKSLRTGAELHRVIYAEVLRMAAILVFQLDCELILNSASLASVVWNLALLWQLAYIFSWNSI